MTDPKRKPTKADMRASGMVAMAALAVLAVVTLIMVLLG